MALTRCSLTSIAALACALLMTPTPAKACGGTFCDAMPFQPMPVDQTGEAVLFKVADGQVEVHIQIAYDGEAERFAWLIPLQALPEIEIGSDPMFRRLLSSTWPSWSTYTYYECNEDDPSWSGDGDPGDGDGDPGDGDTGGGPDVLLEQTVGAFDVVVLQGGVASEVIQFLDDNGYEQDPEAEPILQEYLDEGFLFAAVKLTADAEADEIHPLVFRFPGDEPCVPLRLTRIAAQDDMGVRVYFLGDYRWVPSNYAHVVLNPLAYRWASPGDVTYRNMLSAAIDEAGGQAFVTDYVGASVNFTSASIYNPGWSSAAFIGLDPSAAIGEVIAQGLAAHPLMPGILLEFIPPPMGIDPFEFWNNIFLYTDLIDLNAWNDVEFAARVEERIIAPGLNANLLLQQGGKLTALHTMISPHEMTEDPVFHTTQMTAPIDNRVVSTAKRLLCGLVDTVYEVEIGLDEYPVCVPGGSEYPTWDDQMPAALRIEQIPPSGPPQVAVDNAALIDMIYQTYDDSVVCESIVDGGTDSTSTGGTERHRRRGARQRRSIERLRVHGRR